MSQDHRPTVDTDAIIALYVSGKDEIVITSEQGRLRLSPQGLAIEGAPEAFDELQLKAPSFKGYPLNLKLEFGQLTLYAHCGDRWGYKHTLGPLGPDLANNRNFNAMIIVANTRLSLWLDSRS